MCLRSEQLGFLRTFCVLILLSQSSVCFLAAQEAELKIQGSVAGPYCGVFSLITCLRAMGLEVEQSDFIKKEFVSSHNGSSVFDLINAAHIAGVDANSASNLTIRELRLATSPMILNVRSGRDSREYNHWVAFLGFEENGVRIVDGWNQMEVITPANLLANWNGSAIILSGDTGRNDFSTLATFSWVVFILILGSLLGCAKSLFSKMEWDGIAPKLACIGLLTLFLTAGFHSISEIGFFNNRSAVAEVNRRYLATVYPEISAEEFERRVVENTGIIIDARLKQDFRIRSVPGAKSLAVDSSMTERTKVLEDIDRNGQVTVFCQSSSCNYDDEIASFLKFNGFHDVSVYSGGFVEWLQLSKKE